MIPIGGSVSPFVWIKKPLKSTKNAAKMSKVHSRQNKVKMSKPYRENLMDSESENSTGFMDDDESKENMSEHNVSEENETLTSNENQDFLEINGET